MVLNPAFDWTKSPNVWHQWKSIQWSSLSHLMQAYPTTPINWRVETMRGAQYMCPTHAECLVFWYVCRNPQKREIVQSDGRSIYSAACDAKNGTELEWGHSMVWHLPWVLLKNWRKRQVSKSRSKQLCIPTPVLITDKGWQGTFRAFFLLFVLFCFRISPSDKTEALRIHGWKPLYLHSYLLSVVSIAFQHWQKMHKLQDFYVFPFAFFSNWGWSWNWPKSQDPNAKLAIKGFGPWRKLQGTVPGYEPVKRYPSPSPQGSASVPSTMWAFSEKRCGLSGDDGWSHPLPAETVSRSQSPSTAASKRILPPSPSLSLAQPAFYMQEVGPDQKTKTLSPSMHEGALEIFLQMQRCQENTGLFGNQAQFAQKSNTQNLQPVPDWIRVCMDDLFSPSSGKANSQRSQKSRTSALKSEKLWRNIQVGPRWQPQPHPSPNLIWQVPPLLRCLNVFSKTTR